MNTLRMHKILPLLLLILVIQPLQAQIDVKADYVGTSDLKDDDGNRVGQGNMATLSAAYSQPLSFKLNERHQPTAWLMNLHARYSALDNEDGAEAYAPDDIFNAGLNVIHLRPLGQRWSLMATLGAGLYTDLEEVSLNSFLLNGGAIFIYKINSQLDLGIGAGITNSYGAPAALPMFYVKYTTTGRYQIDLTMVGGMKLSVQRRWSDHFATTLHVLDMDGTSAVMKVDGRWKVYSTMLMRSMLMAEYMPTKKVQLSAGFGYTWRRSSRLSGRSFKNFYRSIFSDDDRMHFAPAPTFRIGANIKL